MAGDDAVQLSMDLSSEPSTEQSLFNQPVFEGKDPDYNELIRAATETGDWGTILRQAANLGSKRGEDILNQLKEQDVRRNRARKEGGW